MPISDENNQNNLFNSSNNIINEENNNNNENEKNIVSRDNIAQIERSSSAPKIKKEISKENSKIFLPLNSGRVKLPQVYEISQKKIKIENFNKINNNCIKEIQGYGKIKRNESPQILKITKKNIRDQIVSPMISSSRSKITNSDLNI